MAHNTHRESQDKLSGLTASAAKEVAAARPTIVPVVYTPEEKAAKVSAARIDFDRAHGLLKASESVDMVAVSVQAEEALALIDNPMVRDMMRAGLSQQLEKNAAGQKAHVIAMRDALNIMLRHM